MCRLMPPHKSLEQYDGNQRQTPEAMQRLKAAYLHTAPGWTALLIEQHYPVPIRDRLGYRLLWTSLRERLRAAGSRFNQEAFLHMDRLDFKQDVLKIQANASMVGDYGLGVYPEQDLPTGWTRAEFEESMVTHKLRPLYHDVLDIRVEEDAALEIMAELMLGSGAFVYSQSELDPGEFYRRATEQWQPLLQHPAMKLFPYIAPVFTAATLAAAAGDAGTMTTWSCGMTGCIRESTEDGGLLIFRRGQDDLLDLLGLNRE